MLVQSAWAHFNEGKRGGRPGRPAPRLRGEPGPRDRSGLLLARVREGRRRRQDGRRDRPLLARRPTSPSSSASRGRSSRTARRPRGRHPRPDVQRAAREARRRVHRPPRGGVREARQVQRGLAHPRVARRSLERASPGRRRPRAAAPRCRRRAGRRPPPPAGRAGAGCPEGRSRAPPRPASTTSPSAAPPSPAATRSTPRRRRTDSSRSTRSPATRTASSATRSRCAARRCSPRRTSGRRSSTTRRTRARSSTSTTSTWRTSTGSRRSTRSGRAAEINPENRDKLVALGRKARAEGDLAHARQVFATAAAAAPKDTSILTEYASVLLQMKDLDAALEPLTKAAAAEPGPRDRARESRERPPEEGPLEGSREGIPRGDPLRPRLRAGAPRASADSSSSAARRPRRSSP